MSARPRKPTRAIEGRTINKMEALRAEREWNPYLAGDEVYRICGIGATTSYPRPIPLSTSGVLEVSSLADTLESTPMRYL
ncbi:unnamed protein product [Toxocara canis]|nr:unnamed protein product [Toxocara canis]